MGGGLRGRQLVPGVPALLIALVLTLAAAGPGAAAYNPGAPGTDPRDHLPNDPGYAPHESVKFPNCPLGSPSIYDEQYGWFSFAPLGPACQGNEAISGVSLDRAFQLDLGRPDVVIAQVDTGINWTDTDLRRQVHLNWGELPPPENAQGVSSCAGVNLTAVDRRGPAPACYANGQTYGNPGKPFFNVDSYAADPRVSDYNEVPSRPLGENTNPAQDADGGKINAADLIHTFTSWCTLGPGGAWIQDAARCAGQDNDGNGYAHDIAGWNFLDDNNDPYDLSSYTTADDHGTGRADDAVDEANNGIGGVGACPQCTYLPLRLHSFFINDVNGYGVAASYAVDNGASVVELAFASANNTPFAKAATAYVVSHGAVPVSITQDLNTADHLYPESYQDVFTVAGCVPDTQGLSSNGQSLQPHTYFRNSNTTAPGDHLDACMSGAVTGSVASAQTTGVLGLLISRSRDLAEGGWLPRPLTPLEAEQVMVQTADPVATLQVLGPCPCPPSAPLPPYGFPDPPAPGDSPPRATSAQLDGAWSSAFGYGRLNTLRALESLGSPAGFATPSGNNSPAMPMAIPPELSLSSPDWWDQLDPTTQPQLALQGYIAHDRCPGPATFKVDAAPGAEPTTSQYQTALSRPMSGNSERGNLGTLSVASLPVAQASGPAANREAFTVTLRLSVDDSCHRHGEIRRVVHVHHEAGIHAGFPIDFHAGMLAAVHNTDLRGDGHIESIVANDAGELHVLDSGGHDVPWFNGGHPFLSLPSGFLNHPQTPAMKRGLLPVAHSSLVATPAVGDLFGDGRQEIVAVDVDGRVYVLDGNGQVLPGFPVTPDPALSPVSNESKLNHQQKGDTASPALGHLDDAHPDQLDIVLGALDQRLYVWRPDGVLLPSFNGGRPKELIDTTVPLANRQFAQVTSTPAVGPLTGDGHDQVVVPTTEYYAPATQDINALKTALITSLKPSGSGTLVDAAAIAVLQQVVGVSNRTYAVDRQGAMIPGWPVSVTGLVPDLLAPVGTVPALLGDFGSGPRAVLSLLSAPTYTYKGDGTVDTGLSVQQGAAAGTTDRSISLDALGHGAIGDISGTGPGIFEGGISANGLVNLLLVGQNLPFDHLISGWDPRTGLMYPTFPQKMEDFSAFVEPAVAPVGDPLGNSVISGSGLYLVHAYDIAGQEAPGFPKFTGGWASQAPALADLAGKGTLDLLIGTHEGWLYQWSTTGAACGNSQWWSNHHDEWNSGAYGKVTRPPGAITDFHLGGPNNLTAGFTWSGAEFACGTATSADIRVSNSPITPGNFAQAAEASGLVPGGPGSAGSQAVSAGSGACLYVALQVRNSAGLRSPLAEAVRGIGCAPVPNQPGITPAGITVPITLPNTAMDPAALEAVLLGLVMVGVLAVRRRRGAG
ncbi:MAG TPA: S8 family serine peptidase [Candidatus Dormibacteraeota bacterium]